MNKHTPGPWEINKFGEGEVDDVTATTNQNRICTLEPDLHHKGEMRANARLISAAPDLLDMLEFVLADENTELCGDTYELIEATIAKAKGE